MTANTQKYINFIERVKMNHPDNKDFIESLESGFLTCMESVAASQASIVYLDGSEHPTEETEHPDNHLKINDATYDSVYDIGDGLRCVELDGKANCLDSDGRTIFPRWFDYIGGFIDGLSRVSTNGKYNFINKTGHFLSPMWFDGESRFHGNFAIVELDGKRNFIRKNGLIISHKWFDDAMFSSEDDETAEYIASVTLGERHGLLGIDGTIEWL